MARDCGSLEIYRLAEELTLLIYKITKDFPKQEQYGLTSQLRRATVSVAVNIADGYGRYHFKDRTLFLYNSRGSLLEVKSLVSISYKLGYLKKKGNDQLLEKIDRLGVKINNFITYLKKK